MRINGCSLLSTTLKNLSSQEESPLKSLLVSAAEEEEGLL
jgi:hypothetical protein